MAAVAIPAMRHAREAALDASEPLVDLVTPPAPVALLRAHSRAYANALLELLTPSREFVTLRGGLTLPLPAFQLAWNLEERGFRLSLEASEHIAIDPDVRPLGEREGLR